MVEPYEAYFSAFGTDAVLAGVAVRGVLDLPSAEDLDVVTTQPSFLLRPTVDVGPSSGQVLQIGADRYTVRQVLKEPPDGVFQRLVLARA